MKQTNIGFVRCRPISLDLRSHIAKRNGLKCISAEMSQNSSRSTVFKLRLAVGRMFCCTLRHVRYLLVIDSVRTDVRTMITLLAASLDQGIESFHCSMRIRRATSSRNALTSSPVRAASDTYIYNIHCVPTNVHRFIFQITVSKINLFNDFWCVKSLENLTLIAGTFAHLK